MNRIKELRLKHQITQRELADYLNLTPKAISFYELEQRDIPIDTLKKIAQYFHVSTDYLLGHCLDKQPDESTEEFIVRMLTSNDVKPANPKRIALFRLIPHIPSDKLDLALSLLSCLRQDSSYIPTGEWDIDKARIEKESGKSTMGNDAG